MAAESNKAVILLMDKCLQGRCLSVILRCLGFGFRKVELDEMEQLFSVRKIKTPEVQGVSI